MKSLHLTIVLLLGLGVHLFAQTGAPMEISVTRVAEAADAYDLVVAIDLTESLRDGLALELPAKISAIPVAVEVNGEALWLKQSAETPVAASTLTWFRDDSGRVVLHFTENRLGSGDRLMVRCSATMKNRPEPGDDLTLKRLAREGNGVRASDEVMTSRELPVIEETN